MILAVRVLGVVRDGVPPTLIALVPAIVLDDVLTPAVDVEGVPGHALAVIGGAPDHILVVVEGIPGLALVPAPVLGITVVVIKFKDIVVVLLLGTGTADGKGRRTRAPGHKFKCP